MFKKKILSGSFLLICPPPSPPHPYILQESLFRRNKKDPSDKEGADEGDEDGRGGFEDDDEEKKKIRLDEDEEGKHPLTQGDDAIPDRGVVKQAISEPEIRTRCDEELTSNDPHLMGYKRMTVAGE